MSDSSDSEFEGFPDASVDEGPVDDVVPRQNVPDSDSDISLGEDSSDEEGDNGASVDDAGGDETFSERLSNVNIPQFSEPTGPRHALLSGASELSFLMLLFTADIILNIVDQTNRFAAQCQADRAVRDPSWYDTTIEEMKAYLGMNILMGIHVLPQIGNYWSSDDYLGVHGIMAVMSRSRFKKITQYLHINDNTTAVARGERGYDPLHKIRPLLSATSNSFARRYRPGRDLSIDEAMVAFKGRSFMKQYMPAKPVKWGFKVWTVAEAATGYVCGYEIYTGRRAVPSQHGLGYDVVMQLTEVYQYQRRHLYFDNFFSSVQLMRDLEQCLTYACGTVRSNRKGLPPAIKKPGRMQRGESIKWQSGNLVAVVWHDNRDVRMLSTNTNPEDGVVQRRVGREVLAVPCPNSVINYNAHMGGVDLADQKRSYYGVGRESVKFWRYLVWYILNTAIINSYIIYTQSLTRPLTHEQYMMTHLKYRLKIVKQLIAGFSSRKRAGRKVMTAPVMQPSGMIGHDLVKMAKKLVCRNCSQQSRKTQQGRGVATTWKCKACDVPLCRDGCLIEYHTRHSV